MYAVDKKFAGEWKSMDDTAVCFAIQEKSLNPILVTLSGGNPALFDFSGVIARMQECGYTFTIETQGSVPRSWFTLLDHMTLSPKPPSSGMKTDYGKLAQCMAWLEERKISLKIVVADDADYDYARAVAARHPRVRCYLQVCNPDPASVMNRDLLLERLEWLSNKVLADRWFTATVLPQLHVLMFGNRRGV
jgi:7-carboxy-7-deazaguanine synthase